MNTKKKLAAKILKTSHQKVRFADGSQEEISKAITRADMRGLIAVGKIQKITPNEQSRVRARENAAQKSKGRRKGKGSRKGRKFSRISRKEQWMTKIRLQRVFLKELRERRLLSPTDYRLLYAKSKGGYFRNKRHIKLYLSEQNLLKKEGAAEKKILPGREQPHNKDRQTGSIPSNKPLSENIKHHHQ
ncbi:50S ribosomal protein L19e [Candidatus Woesearchaeota archaeon]|nr:50S ribosomal protein L19e [Candidatus Woesearchaeota archaeon]